MCEDARSEPEKAIVTGPKPEASVCILVNSPDLHLCHSLGRDIPNKDPVVYVTYTSVRPDPKIAALVLNQ
jgi:hypothetical protein